jgi:phosphopantothenoylcysteine decarboxylase/phosphopantothenate--cysteine ligase
MKVALGVTGCIAAYKSVEILRGLQKREVAVQVVMTRHAQQFVGPLTFQSISGLAVIADMFAETDDPQIKHIQLAGEIDLLVVAPATANILAKFARGLADDFLSTLYISTTAPLLVAPAMNVEMWAHPATQENVRILRERGAHFVDPEEGYLACRTVGAGRLAAPEKIINRAWELLTLEASAKSNEKERDERVSIRLVDTPCRDLEGERVLITAGPTFEALDPVRGITNRSSGKMGYALAEAALARGAEVTLVSGPVSLHPPDGARTISVRSAEEMRRAVMDDLEDATMVICAAAVADYRPVSVAEQKIKKSGDRLVIEMEKTPDILAAVGRKKGDRVVVGFAAETENLTDNARKKLIEKNADLIVANDVTANDSGFDVDTNRIALITEAEMRELPLLSKREAADWILDAALRIKQAAIARA